MKLILVALLIAMPCTVSAAPAVTGTSGTLSHGNSFTVTGSGFGTKSFAAPVAFGDMENNSLTARIGAWTDTDGYPDGKLSVSTAHARHANSTYCATGTFVNSNERLAFTGGSDATTWFVQYWVYLDSGFDWGAANIKLFRMWSTGSSTENLRVQSYNRVDVAVENCDLGHGGWGTGWNPVTSTAACADVAYNSGRTCNTSDWLPGSLEWRNFQTDVPKGSWNLMQFEFRDGTASTADGVLRWWVNGRLVFNHSDITTRTNTTAKRPQVVGFYRDSTADGSGALYLDDAYIDNTWQRVEIGNNATYNNCTLREIQPSTSWADGSVTFTVNQGSFSDSSTGYVFVTDASGVRNAGYQVTFGTSGSGSTGSLRPGVSASGVTFR